MDKEFLLNTTRGMDKIMGVHTGSFYAAPRYDKFRPRRSEIIIDHDYGTWGLVRVVYSLGNGIWLPAGVVKNSEENSSAAFQTIEVNAFCADTTCGVVASNFLEQGFIIEFALQVIARE